jgi:hypothetical protein
MAARKVVKSLKSAALAPTFFIVAVFASHPATIQGQNPKQPQVPKTDFRCTGTVKDVRPGLFQLAGDDGEQWLVQIAAQPKDIVYSGSADMTFLRPGMFVRISSKLNRRGQTDEKIGNWTAFTPKPDTKLGLITEQTRSTDPNLFIDSKAEKRPKPKPSLDPTYEIAGRITKVTRTEITIDAAGTQVRAQVADKSSVTLDLADLSYLRPGDKVEFSGWHVTGEKGRGWATKITATAAEPLADSAAKKSKAPQK